MASRTLTDRSASVREPRRTSARNSNLGQHAPPTGPWSRELLAWGLAGSFLLWLALPPLSWSILGWIAPIPWLILIQRESLAGRRPYRVLWFAGLAFWLLALQWLRLPHPATSLGWIALSAYLACYLPLFVGLSRVAVHRTGCPLWLAGPVVWTGLELLRAHLFTGFLLAALAHTQTDWTGLIQISDVLGGYGVSFLMLFVAGCLTIGIPWPQPGRPLPTTGMPPGNARRNAVRWPPLLAAAIAIAMALTYGNWRLAQQEQYAIGNSAAGPRVALIQGNSLADWKMDAARQRQIMQEYTELSRDAVARARTTGDGRKLDLIVWPETMFRQPLVQLADGYTPPPDMFQPSVEQVIQAAPNYLAYLAEEFDTALLVGIDRRRVSAGDGKTATITPYNSSILVDREGQLLSTYDKVHRVMFGEYVPLASSIPMLYQLTPLTGGIAAGAGPVAMKLGDTLYAPNICYETVVPHVIRRQLVELSAADRTPDVLVNLTNDAWYWGSSGLDMHLDCGVFRAVECRRPMVIAANGGLSAVIDSSGRVLHESPRQATDVIVADVPLDPRTSPYVVTGDWFAGLCLAACALLAVRGWRTRDR